MSEADDSRDDDTDGPLPRDPKLLRERLLDAVSEAAQDDIVAGRTEVAVTHRSRVQTAALRNELFGEPIGPIPFDPEEERRVQQIKAEAETRMKQAQLAAILSRGIGEA